MAKYRHRIFEMYDFLDEAILAVAATTSIPTTMPVFAEGQGMTYLDLTQGDGVTRVVFRGNEAVGQEALPGLRNDLALLAENLPKDSKIVIDFEGVESFSATAIDELARFNQKLKNKGSRTVLCCLAPAVREAFFPQRSP